MKLTSLRYLDAKFHHPSLGASPPNRGKSICLPPEFSLLLKRRSVNKFRHRYSTLWWLAIPALAGLLVYSVCIQAIRRNEFCGRLSHTWDLLFSKNQLTVKSGCMHVKFMSFRKATLLCNFDNQFKTAKNVKNSTDFKSVEKVRSLTVLKFALDHIPQCWTV